MAPTLSSHARACSSAARNHRPELGLGVVSTAFIGGGENGVRLRTGCYRRRFDPRAWEAGLMVRDSDGAYGYVVQGSLAYLINSADSSDDVLVAHGRRLARTVHFVWVRVAWRCRWELAILVETDLQVGMELIEDYMVVV